MFLTLKNILHKDATDGCSAVISPKAPSERGLREAVGEPAYIGIMIFFRFFKPTVKLQFTILLPITLHYITKLTPVRYAKRDIFQIFCE